MVEFIKNGKLIEATEIDQKKIKAINDGVRLEILELLQDRPMYPAEIADQLEMDKQKVYYHIDILKESGVIEKDREEKKSGGLATYYRTAAGGLLYDLGGEGQKVNFGRNNKVKKFLNPLVDEAELDGYIVVGSPDEHGSDQVRARDGHLAGEIGLKLGQYGSKDIKSVKLDTEVVREEIFDRNLLIIGGILTNTVTKKFNGSLPVKFEGEEFPYRKIQTPESEYSQPDIGFIARANNPENPDKTIILVAGVRNKGTEAAVLAFKDLENILDGYEGEEFYCVVRGLDMDGDGEIDDYELIESY